MDAAVVVAPDDGAFHYSPLKLAEYLAAGLAVIAPDVPTVASRLVDGTNVVLVPPTDRPALTRAAVRLRDDPALRAAIGRAARAEAEANWSWDEQVRRIRDRLGTPGEPAAVDRSAS
jgi:glycosyltransferase involved in cell wall biosynthesis